MFDLNYIEEFKNNFKHNEESTNLLMETIEKLNDLNKSFEDIIFIGTNNGNNIVKDISILNVDYDSGYGLQEILENLVIVFNDHTWLSRHEYDGAEWWKYNKLPTIKQDAAELKNVKYKSE